MYDAINTGAECGKGCIGAHRITAPDSSAGLDADMQVGGRSGLPPIADVFPEYDATVIDPVIPLPSLVSRSPAVSAKCRPGRLPAGLHVR